MGKKSTWTIRFRGVKQLYVLSLLFLGCCVSFAGAQEESNIRVLFEKGQEAYEEKRYQEAVDYFENVIRLNNNFAGAYYSLGLVYQEISTDPAYPLWYFQTAIQIDPNFSPSYDALCRSYYQLQKYLEAETVCLKALELNPDLVSSQLSLAWVYLIGRSDANRAIQYFEKVIKKIDTPFIYFGLGMAYAMRGEHGRVLDIVTQLRSEGMEEFAVYLEAVVRSKTSPEKFMPPSMIKEEPQISVEEAVDPQSFPTDAEGRQIVPVPIVVTPKITGSPQIHITGKINPPQVGVTGTAAPITYGGQKGPHPGGLSE